MQEEKSPFEFQIKLEYAEPGRRFLAAMIDGIIIGIVFKGIEIYLKGHYPATEENEYIFISLDWGRLLVQWLYFSIMESSPLQATLGKMAYGLRVTDEEGLRISFWKATQRYFSKFLSAIILLYGFIMIMRNEKRQGLHDKIAHTVVVY